MGTASKPENPLLLHTLLHQPLDLLELEIPLTKEEIDDVIKHMPADKSPGPDGFRAEFYQHFWNLIKDDLKMMFDDLYKGTLDIKRLNYGIIRLIPKTKEANQIQKFRPICLLNVSFKIFTKV